MRRHTLIELNSEQVFVGWYDYETVKELMVNLAFLENMLQEIYERLVNIRETIWGMEDKYLRLRNVDCV